MPFHVLSDVTVAECCSLALCSSTVPPCVLCFECVLLRTCRRPLSSDLCNCRDWLAALVQSSGKDKARRAAKFVSAPAPQRTGAGPIESHSCVGSRWPLAAGHWQRQPATLATSMRRLAHCTQQQLGDQSSLRRTRAGPAANFHSSATVAYRVALQRLCKRYGSGGSCICRATPFVRRCSVAASRPASELKSAARKVRWRRRRQVHSHWRASRTTLRARAVSGVRFSVRRGERLKHRERTGQKQNLCASSQ